MTRIDVLIKLLKIDIVKSINPNGNPSIDDQPITRDDPLLHIICRVIAAYIAKFVLWKYTFILIVNNIENIMFFYSRRVKKINKLAIENVLSLIYIYVYNDVYWEFRLRQTTFTYSKRKNNKLFYILAVGDIYDIFKRMNQINRYK